MPAGLNGVGEVVSLPSGGVSKDCAEPLRRHTPGVGKVDLVVQAVVFQAMLVGEGLHGGDRLGLVGVGTDAQHLDAPPSL